MEQCRCQRHYGQTLALEEVHRKQEVEARGDNKGGYLVFSSCFVVLL